MDSPLPAPSLKHAPGDGSGGRELLLLDHAPILGGAEWFALRLLEHAPSRGYSVRIACPPRSPLAARARHAGIEIVGCDFPELVPWLAVPQARAVAAIRRLLAGVGDGAVVVANSARAQAYSVLAAVLMRHPPPLVHLAHEQDTARRVTARWALPRRGALVAVGAASAAAYRSAIPSIEVTQVNNFLPAAEIERLRRGPRPASAGGALAVIGRMIPEKGILTLLDELAAVPAAWRTLSVAASPEDRGYERQVRARAARPDLEDRVRVLGQVDDLRRLLHAVDAVVVPSTGLEGQPGAILEGLAAGVGVVVREPLRSADFAALPVFAYRDRRDIAEALEWATRAEPAPVQSLLGPFGPDQALDGIELAAARVRLPRPCTSG